tara:strand:- start:3376 stop:4677 length:1302 start_codon:yes stop_codon:yes gene_type:complete
MTRAEPEEWSRIVNATCKTALPRLTEPMPGFPLREMGGYQQTSYMASSSVMIVEDDDGLSFLLGKACANIGLDTVIHRDAAELLHQSKVTPPDILVLDLHLGATSGIDCLEKLLADGFRGQVILISGCHQRVCKFSQQVCVHMGASVLDVLEKPFSMTRFIGVIEQALTASSAISVEALRDGLNKGEFVPFFQPIIDLHRDEVAGVEILSRWQNPAHGLMGPQHFIDAIEQLGLMDQLTMQILKSSIAISRNWPILDQPLCLSINVSPSMVIKPDFSSNFLAAIHEAGGTPEHIKLELTESLAFSGIERIMQVLTRLRIAGLELSIDDFGTGYSSLTVLHQLPFSDLKIDRSFVARMLTDPEAGTIVHTLISLAHNLGLKVVAEGIETGEVLDSLREHGCDLAQGYLFSKPLSEADFALWLEKEGLNRMVSGL